MTYEVCDWCDCAFDIDSEGGMVEGLPCCDDCLDRAWEEMDEEMTA